MASLVGLHFVDTACESYCAPAADKLAFIIGTTQTSAPSIVGGHRGFCSCDRVSSFWLQILSLDWGFSRGWWTSPSIRLENG
jgi:hypothetical protein